MVVRKLEKSMAGRRQLIETMSHREPRGVCLHWAVSKNPNSVPLSLPPFFFWEAGQKSWFGWSNIEIMVVGIGTRRLWFHPPLGTDCLTLPSPSPSCLVSVSTYRQSNPGRTAAHLGVVRAVVLATLAQREFPS